MYIFSFVTDHYYIAQDGEKYQILLTFPNIEIVRYIMLYYYSNATGNQSLPRVSMYIVDDNFNVWDNPTKSWINEVGPASNPSNAGLKQGELQSIVRRESDCSDFIS